MSQKELNIILWRLLEIRTLESGTLIFVFVHVFLRSDLFLILTMDMLLGLACIKEGWPKFGEVGDTTW